MKLLSLFLMVCVPALMIGGTIYFLFMHIFGNFLSF